MFYNEAMETKIWLILILSINGLNFFDISVTDWNLYICKYFVNASAFQKMKNDLTACWELRNSKLFSK